MHIKPRVLYVDQDYSSPKSPEDHARKRDQDIIAEALHERFEIWRGYGLSDKTIGLLGQVNHDQPYGALITHMPTNIIKIGGGNREVYGRSIELIKDIKKSMPNLKIVFYEREGPLFSVLLQLTGANCFIKKTSDPRSDAQKISQALEKMLLQPKP